MTFYHPRLLDHLPESRGVHLIKCRGCSRKFESLTPPDPDDPLTFYCVECLLNGRVKRMKEDHVALEKIRRIVGYGEEPKTESDWMKLTERFKEKGEEKIEEATKVLEEAVEDFRLAAECFRQAIIMRMDSGLNKRRLKR